MTDREMLEMLVEGQKQIFLRLDGVDSRLDGIDNRLDGIDDRLDGIDVRLDGIDRELLAIKNRQDTLEGRQRLLEKKFDHLVNVDIKHLKDTQDTICSAAAGERHNSADTGIYPRLSRNRT